MNNHPVEVFCLLTGRAVGLRREREQSAEISHGVPVINRGMQPDGDTSLVPVETWM